MNEYEKEYLGPDGRIIQPDLRIGLIVVPGFTFLPFAGFLDTLRHAADESDRSRQVYLKWKLLSQTLEPVPSSSGVSVDPWCTLGQPDEFDYLVVFGGQTHHIHPGLEPTYEFLRQAAECHVPLVGMCLGAFVLAEAGLLKGRRCALHFRNRDEFQERYPDSIPVVDELFVVDQDRLTCPGGTAAIDLAVRILLEHCSEARAKKGLAHMMVDAYRDGSHVPRHPYDDLGICKDSRVVQAVRLMRQNITFPYSIKELADRLDCTPRQLERAFQEYAQVSPARFWRQLRLHRARWFLLNTTHNVTQIAYECGFSDCAHFTKHFTKSFGESPSRFREVRLKAAQSLR